MLSRVHSTEYLSFVNNLSKDLERKTTQAAAFQLETSPVVPFTPMVQRSMIKIAEDEIKDRAASDTSFSVGSLRAARRAAGAVQHAVDWYVIVGNTRRSLSTHSQITVSCWDESATHFARSDHLSIMRALTGCWRVGNRVDFVFSIALQPGPCTRLKTTRKSMK